MFNLKFIPLHKLKIMKKYTAQQTMFIRHNEKSIKIIQDKEYFIINNDNGSFSLTEEDEEFSNYFNFIMSNLKFNLLFKLNKK